MGNREFESGRAQLAELIDKFDTAMLVTFSPEGWLHARPMALAGHDDPLRTLYFVTDRDAPKVQEISMERSGLVSLQGSAKFVSLSGTLAVDPVTRSDIESIFKPRWRVWFEDEESSASLGLIRFLIDHAEYWDRSGPYRWRILLRTGRAALRREKLDEESLPGHAKVDVDGAD